MLSSLLALAIIIFQTMLATLITTRSREQLASRLFIGFSIVLISMIGGVLLRDVASTPTAAYVSLGLSTVMLGGYFTLLLLLISALFVPQWWEGPTLLRRPILWISLPYVLITAAIGVDFIARIGFLVEGVYFADVYRIKYAYPASAVVILLAALGQFALLVVLGFAFFDPRHHQARPAIIVLALCIVFSLVMGALSPRLGRLVNQITQIQIFPLVGALGYLVLGTRLFSPTRAALDMALGALREAIAVTDASGAIVFANPSARRLGLQVGQPLDAHFGLHIGDVLAGHASNDDRIAFGLRTAERHLEVVVVPIRDPHNEHQGALALVRDVSEAARYQSLLETERARLAATLADLQRARQQEERLVATVRSLSLPLIPVLPGVLVMPLIGDFHGARMNEFLDALLQGIETRRASTVMLDITGVTRLDAEGAHGLMTGMRAAALLGARCVLVGVQPEVAQALIATGVTLSDVPTAATLEQAVVGQLARKHG